MNKCTKINVTCQSIYCVMQYLCFMHVASWIMIISTINNIILYNPRIHLVAFWSTFVYLAASYGTLKTMTSQYERQWHDLLLTDKHDMLFDKRERVPYYVPPQYVCTGNNLFLVF